MAPSAQYPLTSSNDIQALFWNAYLEPMNAGMITDVAMYSPSDSELETYHFLGASPTMREWIGGRHAQTFRQNNFTIKNLDFEASVAVKVKDLRREKYGQIAAQIAEMGFKASGHASKLLSELIATGESALAYDGFAYFAANHAEGQSGTQSNLVTVTMDELGIPTGQEGTPTNPTPEVMARGILKAVERLYSFKDDKGEPINQNAMKFAVQVPTALMSSTMAAINNDAFAANRDNTVRTSGLQFIRHVDPRSAWTNKFAVYVADSHIKPFIHQEEKGVILDVIGEGSEHEFKYGEHLYGVQLTHNVGFGDWRRAVLCNLSAS